MPVSAAGSVLERSMLHSSSRIANAAPQCRHQLLLPKLLPLPPGGKC
jgi:hypothetical protein